MIIAIVFPLGWWVLAGSICLLLSWWALSVPDAIANIIP